MEERPVLVVLELIVKFVVPYDASCAQEIDELEEEDVFGSVIGECESTLEAAVRPFVAAWVGEVDAGGDCSKDLVEGRRNGRSDPCLFIWRERLWRHF